jgi:biopolymer transport protein ExbD
VPCKWKCSCRSGQRRGGARGQSPAIITLDAEGKLYFNHQLVIEEELALYLHNLASKGRKEITIHSDRRVDLGRAIKVMDMCRKAGLTGVMLNAVAPKVD